MTLMPAGKNCNLGWAWWHTPEILALVEERQVELCEICQLQVSTDDHWVGRELLLVRVTIIHYVPGTVQSFSCTGQPYHFCRVLLVWLLSAISSFSPSFPIVSYIYFIKTVQAIKWKLTQLAFTTIPNMATWIPIEQMLSLLKYSSVHSSCSCSSHFLLD